MFAKPTPRTYAAVTMYTGMAATLLGNAAAADWSDPIAVIISALPAFALFVVFEMVIRSRAVPTYNRWYHKMTRMVPAIAIMAIAAKTSYGHLLHVSQAHGQHGVDAYLMAALPDAMMICATVVLKFSPQTRATTAAAPATRKASAKKATAKTPRTRKPSAAVAQAPALVPGNLATVTSLLTVPQVPSRRTRTVTA